MISTPEDVDMIESFYNGKVMKIYINEDESFDTLPV